MVLYCLLDEINGPTASLENARDFLFQKNLLKSSMSCPGCNAAMSLVPCSSSKSPDGLIWRCSPCKKYKNIRADSALSGQKIALKTFIQLLFCLSIKGLTGIAVSQMTVLSENTVSDWKIYLHTRLADWLLANPNPLGGPGVIVEVDEAKFGKRKYNKGGYREGMWVLGGVDRNTGQCFLLPCPDNRRGAGILLPLIRRWILPGSIIYTDEWAAYNSLTAEGFTHGSVNHTYQFVDPQTGIHTNTQEGLWYHVKKSVIGTRDLELSLIDFMFKRRFNATGGPDQIVNCFNAYISVLAV